MASLYRPNSVQIFNAETEETTSLYVRVDHDSDKVVFAVMGEQEEITEDYAMSIEETLALIVDLTTAAQVALANRK